MEQEYQDESAAAADGQPPQITIRRTLKGDISTIRHELVRDDAFILGKRFGEKFNLSTILETSYLCVTGLDEHDNIVAFAAFTDGPSNVEQLRGEGMRQWESIIDAAISPTVAAKGRIKSCNTLFLTFFVTKYGNGAISENKQQQNQEEQRQGEGEGVQQQHEEYHPDESAAVAEESILMETLSTVFATCPQHHRVAFVLPTDTPAFEPITSVLFPVPLADNTNLHGTLYTVQREDINIPMVLRPGVVEDYDDFIPLLLAGVGLVTPLPQTLYLDELLQDQDPYTSVIVAEDPDTHQVVGIMCLDASYEAQQAAVKQYQTDPFNKLKPLAMPQSQQFRLETITCEEDVVADSDPVDERGQPRRERHAPPGRKYVPKKHGKGDIITVGQHQNHNSFQITFFYLNPAYESRSAQFIAYAFNTFRFAEYGYIYLPHAAPEHPLLYHFAYTAIKKFQPSNAQGERLPLPEGMWLCCRYGMEDVSTSRFSPTDEEATGKLLRVQNELPQTAVESIMVSLSQVIQDEDDGGNNNNSALNCIMLNWRRQPVGFIVTRAATVDEMYALRRNFDLDEFVNFAPHADENYDATNITLPVDTAKTSFYRNDMPGHVIKHMFVKPIFRKRLRFLLREALRYLGAEVLLHVVQPSGDLYNPLVSELIFTPPRRVVDRVRSVVTGDSDLAKNNGDSNNSGGDQLATKKREKWEQDVDGLICLYHTSRKSLSDEKTQIHARIVVIGASSTGLAFIYTLLTIPYLHFSNILLVSPNGLPEHPNHREHLWSVDNMEWLEREYLLLRLPGRIRVLEGQMTDFDKVDKYVFTVGGTCEPYDQLMIATGRQYTIPREMTAHHGAKNGVFPLNGAINLVKIQQHLHESEIYEDDLSSAVIYGSSLDVYCVASSIIRLGLAPQRIVIVSPEDEAVSGSPFLDSVVDLKSEKLLSSLGTKLLKGYTLERLDYDEDNNLSLVVVTPINGGAAGGNNNQGANNNGNNNNAGNIVEIGASMFIYAHDKDIDTNVLSALNKRSIVFDGRVIVENNYRTTDPNIFAAGPVAMFSLRFGSSRDFEEYSITEVGRHVAHTLLGFLGVDEFYDELLHKEVDKAHAPKDDPLAAELGSRASENVETTERQRPKPLPKYEDVISKRVVLPGNHIFFICHSVDFPMMLNDCQHLTSSDSAGNNYLRVSIGPNRYIEAVTFFGDQSVELYNLRSIVGMPESVLNLVYNYTEYGLYNKGQQLDMLQYFRSPWSHIIFYDKFPQLFLKIKELLKGHGDVEHTKEEMLEVVVPQGADTITEEERLSYHNRLAHDHSDARRLIELELIKFMHQHKPFLPQYYFLPDIHAHVPQYN